VERIFFLFPIVYAGFIFGLRGGIVCLVTAVAVMMPRALFVSAYPRDALFEVGAIIAFGAIINWWLESRRREGGRREQIMLQLEANRRELQSYIQSIKESERRLSALQSFSSAVNQSLDLQEVLDTAADKIKEAIDVDVILLLLLDEEVGRLGLKVHRGVSKEFASKVDGLKIGEGLNGWVAQTGEPCLVIDSTSDPRASPEVVKREGIKSQFIVPLRTSDKVIGTLCVATHDVRQFTTEEKELLVLVSIQLGVAIEKVYFFQELQRVGGRFQEIFEKAHDAIWIQDFQGRIINANQAAARLTGYELKDLIGKHVSELLTPEGLELARQVRQKLLHGEPIKQPYGQRLLRKDGTQALLMLSTSLLENEGTPLAFQHIARDITEETKLQEALELYAAQISQAHEEERKRIARELHDDTIQTMIAVSRRLDDFASRDSVTLKEVVNSLGQLREDIDKALIRTRRFIQDLRPPTLEYLGLVAALRELATQVQEQSGIKVNLKVKGSERRFTSEEELLIYRITQEAIRNIWRHSEATKAELTIEFNEEKTVVVVSDNGKGCEVGESSEFLKAGKLGLMGMKERAHLLGGTLEVRSKPGKGTTVILRVPSRSL
jgi:PAS domain S-box-containing protein